MARAADGGRAAELVTRDFLGGCVAAADDARDAAAATARHDSVTVRQAVRAEADVPGDAEGPQPLPRPRRRSVRRQAVPVVYGGGGGGGSVGDGAVEQGDGCDSPSAGGGGGMVAAACPRCFLYVLISRSDPRCPRCESHVPPPPSPAPKKKPRIDLNVGFLGT
uniref:GIR1-like zinc ribbon domain-containing protein n=1 Tax=Oryza punctata TaxID=4537 RepID=A0A0E0KH27_ORYPU